MTRFFEHKRPDKTTLTTQLHRTYLFESDHPILTQIVRRNDLITDIYALGPETPTANDNHPVYPNTVCEHAPPKNTQPTTYFTPFTEQSFSVVKAPYHNNLITRFGYGAPGQRTYHVVLNDQIRTYHDDDDAFGAAD